MEKTEVEISAKTIDEAIVAGCAELGVGIGEVDFEIIDNGGIFRKMKVKISLRPQEDAKEEIIQKELKQEDAKEEVVQKEVKQEENKKAVKEKTPKKEKKAAKDSEPTHEVVKGEASEFVIEGKGKPPRRPRAELPVTEFNPNAPKFVKTLEFAEKLFKLLDENLTVTANHNDREFIISVHGENVSRLIGKEGHTMACINTIVTSVAISNANGESRRVVVDIENYREKRKQSLAELAKRKAEWVIKSGRTVKLEPMPARERVIIHTVLQDMEGVTTHSQGDEPNRYLIISPSAR
jgi:spoIIIJ-associated protein